MITSEFGKTLIKASEGLRLKTYLDTGGVPTIGWGHTGPDVIKGQTISTAEAELLLTIDLQKFETAVMRLVHVPLNQNQFDALVCLSFNIGIQALADSTLLRMLNARNYAGAADQFLRWNKVDGVSLPGLVKRRAAERSLFLS